MSKAIAVPGIAADDMPQLAQDLYELEVDARTSAECEGTMLGMLGAALPMKERRQREAIQYGYARKAEWLKTLREFLVPGVAVGIGRAPDGTDWKDRAGRQCEGRR